MKRLLGDMKKILWIYLLGFISLIIGLALNFYMPTIMKELVDDVIRKGNTERFQVLGFLLLAVTLGRAVAGFLKELLFDLAGSNLAVELRMKLFQHIQGLSYDFFDEKNTGELISRIKEDADTIWRGASFGVFLTIEMLLTFCLSLFLMFRIHIGLTLIILPLLPLISLIVIKMNRRGFQNYIKISEQKAKLNMIAGEDIAGIRLVKAFVKEKFESQKFLKGNEEYYQYTYEEGKIRGTYFPMNEFLMGIIPIVAVVGGGFFVISDKLSLGVLIQFSLYVTMAMWPLRMTGWVSNLMAETFSSIYKVDEIFQYQSKIKNPENGKKEGEILGHIRFEGVGLTLDGQELLKDISFEVKPGKTLAIMGETGSGKSLITKLLPRFYELSAGAIYLDGVSIADYDLTFLRQQFAFVMQNVFLFSDTIEENINLGQSEFLSASDLERYSKKAMAHDFISKMDQQYETVIGEKGIGLSGGQKQRISIARAFARKSPVLVLDDSTSALDMETEKQIQKSIEEMGGSTKIVVAHRISAVRFADEILVLHEGRIVERGNHAELLAKRGHYYTTYQEQIEFLAE